MAPSTSRWVNTNTTPSPRLLQHGRARAGPAPGPGRHLEHGRHGEAHEQDLRQVGEAALPKPQDSPPRAGPSTWAIWKEELRQVAAFW